jgi:Ca2+-binding RTX toxin-like protein
MRIRHVRSRARLVGLCSLVVVLATAGSALAGEVLHDQYGGTFYGGIGSNDRAGAGLANQLADDFVVPEGVRWRVDGIDARGLVGGSIESVSAFVYADRGGLPGMTLFSWPNVATASGLSNGDYQIALDPPADLVGGTYWISVQATPTTGDDAWFWYVRGDTSGSGAAERADSYCNAWGRILTCESLGDDSIDLMFRLWGEPLASEDCDPALTGTEGDDVLAGTDGPDHICGLGGNDTLTGGAGADVLEGGPGKDRMLGGSGEDTVVGEDGEAGDGVNGQADADTCTADPEDTVRNCEA